MQTLRRWLRSTVPLAALVLGATPGFAQTTTTLTGGFERLTTIAIPGKPLATYDISFIDPATRLYFLSDRSNAGIDVINTRTNRFVTRITGNATVGEFAGQLSSNDVSGPDGLSPADGGRIWAGDGNSTVKIIDLAKAEVVRTVSTGGTSRADEMAFDPRDHVMLVANDADSPPFVTLLSTRPGTERVLARITFDAATNGIEASVYNPRNGLFYVNIPQIGSDQTMGGVAVIDPRTARVLTTFPVRNCQPAGMALGPRRNLLLGCATTNDAAATALATQVIDDFDGSVLATIPQVGGSDEVTYDPASLTYYLAARDNPGGSVLGVINARNNRFVGEVATGKASHSVAADPSDNHAYVALPANAADPACLNGCVGVYGNPRKGTLAHNG